MKKTNINSILQSLETLGIQHIKGMLWNLSTAELVEEAIKRSEGVLTDTGALMCDTGKFTGRAPKDRFIVKDEITKDKVWWGDINIPFEEDKFDQLFNKMIRFLGGVKSMCAMRLPGLTQNTSFTFG